MGPLPPPSNLYKICPDGSSVWAGSDCPPPPSCDSYTITQGPFPLPGNSCLSYTIDILKDCNGNWISSTPSPPSDNGTCAPCTHAEDNWGMAGPCSVSCGTGTQPQINYGIDHGKGDCTPLYRNIPCSGPPCDPYAGTCNAGHNVNEPLLNDGSYCTTSVDCKSCNCRNNQCCPPGQCCNEQWGGWNTTSSSITGCRQRTYNQTRTSNCGNTQTQQVNQSDGDTSQCPGCYVSRDWYDTSNCPGDGYCGGTKRQHREVSDPYGKGGCPSTDQDVSCPSDHVNSWSGWDNDNGQSKIIGCRRRRYYRYRTTPCGSRQDGDDNNGGYRDSDDGDTSLCRKCTITRDWYDTTPCSGTNGNCGGTKHQKREVSDPDKVGGCPSTDQDVSCPSDGNNNWSSWTNQSSSITGCKERTYVQIRTNQCGQSQTQNVKAADSDTSKCGACTYGAWTPSGPPTITGCKTASQAQTRTAVDNGLGDCGPTTQTVPVASNDTSKCGACTYSAWTPSGPPTITGCKTASQAQSRTVVDNGLGDCGPTTQTITVASTDTSKCAPCTYGAWTPTGNPTVTGCKTASQAQSRTAVDNGKGDCGPTTQTVPVASADTSKCAPCTYSQWTPSGDPTITGCKTASQAQTRTATDNGLGDCGPTTQTISVPTTDISQCPPCQYSEWTDSTPCTAPCNGGTKTQSRTILNTYGRGDCNVGLIQTVPCNAQSCAPCTYGAIDTSTLTPCSAPCGGGTQSGNLLVTDTNGNSSCSPMSSTQSCNTKPCAPPVQYHSIPPPVGRLTPVFSNFEIPKYRIRPPAPNPLVASAPVPSNYNNNIPVASDVYAPFAPANSVSYSSCQTNNSLLDSESLDKFKDLILNAVSNYQKNVSCH